MLTDFSNWETGCNHARGSPFSRYLRRFRLDSPNPSPSIPLPIPSSLSRIRAPGDAPISTILSYAAEKFGVEAATSALLTESGVGIGLAQTVSSVVWSYGTELSLIPRDRVGANS